jgi:transcriptional regulator GlxA family with amidase domain
MLGRVSTCLPVQGRFGIAVEVSGGMTALDPRIRHVLALMERHRREPLTMAQIARAVNLSPSRLRHLFRTELGRSPARAQRELALDHAHHLLDTTFLSVKEVMAECGWNDPSHFCRAFKCRFGYSPASMRARDRGGGDGERAAPAARSSRRSGPRIAVSAHEGGGDAFECGAIVGVVN